MTGAHKTFDELQGDLGAALAANRPGSTTPHMVIAMASHSVNESLLSHYGERVVALEHRFLASGFMVHRLPAASWLYLSSVRPADDVVSYLRRLGPDPTGFEARSQLVALDDTRPRAMAAKLLDRADLLADLRARLAGRLAFIEPWNVTEIEVAIAVALQVPINGADPRLRHLGHKSAGRRLFRLAGAPAPTGSEDVRTVDDVLNAVDLIRSTRPQVAGVVIKHDDSGAGDGNTVVDLNAADGRPVTRDELRRALLALPAWYLADLRAGGIVEELLTGAAFTSPSAQIDLLPDGTVDILATHEQIVGGDNGQVFLGCRFPADPAYAATIAHHATNIGVLLAKAGVYGRASVDFAATRPAGGRWEVHALEVNLRKGGTTHPYSTLRNLVPGRYDPGLGAWLAHRDQQPRAYECTDNFCDPTFLGLTPVNVIRAVRDAGLEFDHRTGTGVVLHMLAGLSIDGRFGLTSIGTSAEHAQTLHERACAVVRTLPA